MIIWKSQDSRDNEKVSSCQVFGRGWAVEHQGVLGAVKLLYDTVMVDIDIMHLVKLLEMYRE